MIDLFVYHLIHNLSPLFPSEVPGLERVLRGAHVDALVVVYQRLLKPAKKTPLEDKTRKKPWKKL